MAIEFRPFTSDLTAWLGRQPKVYSELFPAETYRKLYRIGKNIGRNRTHFDEDQILSVFFDNDETKRAEVHGLAEYLNGRYDGAGPGSAKSAVPKPPNKPPLQARSHTKQSENPGAAPRRASEASSSNLAQLRFPLFDYSEDGVEAWDDVAVSSIEDPTHGEVLTYSWPAAEGNPVYKVVTSETEEPINPDEWETVAICEGTSFDDTSPATSPFRFVTVWAYPRNPNSPNTLQQGRLIARSLYVHPVKNWAMESVDGTSVSSWDPIGAVPGAEIDVKVARLPQGQAPGRYMRGMAWLSLALPNDGTGFRRGFQDTQIEEGNQYSYVAAVHVKVDEQERYSRAITKRYVADAAKPRRVTDLQVIAMGEHQESWRIDWTAPKTGDVQIFRTKTPPNAGAVAREELPKESLEGAGLDEASRLPYVPRPVLDADGSLVGSKWYMESVQWPAGEDWDSAYLTPVTVLDDRCVIGTPVAQRRARRVEQVTLIQRMSWQLVTFEWPGSAVSVNLYRTTGQEVFSPDATPDATIEKEEYERSGGFAIPQPVPTEGTLIHLTSVTYHGGKAVTSAPTSLQVAPLWGYSYSLDWPQLARGVMGKVRSRTIVTMRVEATWGICRQEWFPYLVLVYNSERLPLHANDGVHIPIYVQKPVGEVTEAYYSIVAPTTVPLTLYFDAKSEAMQGHYGGYFRLMVAQAAWGSGAEVLKYYALDDPPLRQLRNG